MPNSYTQRTAPNRITLNQTTYRQTQACITKLSYVDQKEHSSYSYLTIYFLCAVSIILIF